MMGLEPTTHTCSTADVEDLVSRLDVNLTNHVADKSPISWGLPSILQGRDHAKFRAAEQNDRELLAQGRQKRLPLRWRQSKRQEYKRRSLSAYLI